MIENYNNEIVIGVGGYPSDGGGSGGDSILSGTVSTYNELPTTTSTPPLTIYENKFYLVQEGSGGALSWMPLTSIYKYPAGLYCPDPTLTFWKLAPFNVKMSEDSLTLLNISDWSEYIEYAFDIHENDRLIFNDTLYKNLTGTQTTDDPSVDTTNWEVVDSTLQDLQDQISVVTSGDDKGVNFEGQISVATEIIAGEDSYAVPLAFHCTEANTTGTTITSATDVSTILQSDSDSTTGLFGGATAGAYLLVASTKQFEGAKIKISDSGEIEPANIQTQAYINSSIEWSDVSFMATDSNSPYKSRAWNICYEGDTSEQIFLGFNPLTRDEDSIWELNTFTINGVTYEDYYWGRFLIESDITEDATLEQVKLHADRNELESTGQFKFGKARTPFELVSGLSNFITNAQEDPSNRDIEYTTTFTANTTNNRLQYLRDDGVGVVATRKFGLDSSIPLTVTINYYIEGTATGDIEWTIKGSQVNDGYVYDGNNDTMDYTIIETISESSENIRRTIEATVPINTLESDSAVLIEVSRLGSSSANDTLENDIVLTNITVSGYRWKI